MRSKRHSQCALALSDVCVFGLKALAVLPPIGPRGRSAPLELNAAR